MARSVVGHCEWEVLRMTGCVLACLLLALPGGLAFLPNFWSRVLTLSWDSHTHQYMTEQALLNVTLSTLRAVASGRNESGLGRGFWRAVGEVVWANAAMDFLSTTRSDPVYHFDSERVGGAQGMLRLLWAQTLLSARAGDYQDFYSHSNWVEMGQRSIYLHLLHPEQPAVPVASEDTPTCAECYSATCRDNILLSERPPVLTTGYFSANPPKPAGKCSHGGLLDSSRHQGAQGGINKDSTSPFFSPHHYLHGDAARLATSATVAVLQDLRGAIGTASFLRLLSIRQQPAVVFVMDTTGSMFEEITAARRRAFSIIQARARASQQPGKYLLIPFHDPAVGPVYETEDPEQFMLYLEGLTALGGGDEPEMCLSAVQLALTHSPPLSEIFVFTDASPKDAHLYSTVEALTLEKQSKVTFLLTEDSRRRRERRSPDRFSLYSSLSSVSGGLAIFTSNSDIHRVSAIIEDHIAASKVTLLHVGSSSLSEVTHFPFRVDSAVHSVTLHVTGSLKHCILTSPSGESQSLLVRSGSLAEVEVFQGLYRVILLPPIHPGQWHLSIEAEGPVMLNVIGDSTVDFLYYFAVAANGTHPGLERVEGSPVADVPTFLVLAVTGLLPNEEASFSHVTLLGANGESLLKVPLNSSSSSSSSGKQLVGSMASVPREPFYVQLSGRDTTGNRLERVATEMIQPTHVRIQVLSAPPLIPGHTSKVTFDVLNYGPTRHFTLTTADDRGFLTETMHRRLLVGERGSLRGEVDMRTPEGAEPGGAVTVTLTVRAEDSGDSNYAVEHLSILPPDPDVFPPSCSPVRVEAACPPECGGASWAVSLAVIDRGHSGLAALQLTQGHGILTLLLEPSETPPEGPAEGRGQLLLREGEPQLNITSRGRGGGSSLHVRYTSNCCSPHAEITAWDAAGNVHRCHLTPSQQVAVTHKPSSAAGRVGLALFAFQFCLLGLRLLM